MEDSSGKDQAPQQVPGMGSDGGISCGSEQATETIEWEAAMIQCFAKPNYIAGFTGAKAPRLLSASKIDSNYVVHPRVLHKHTDFFEVLFVRSGTGVYIVEEKRYPIKEGDLIICNAGTLHDEDPMCSQDLNTYCVALTNINIPNLPPNHLIDSIYTPVFPSGQFSKTILGLMESIYGLLACDSDVFTEACHYLSSALVSVLLEIIRKNCEKTGNTRLSSTNIIAAQVKNYIDSHYDEDFTLQDIAEAIRVSPYHLSHVFKDETGYSPKQYTLRRRLGEAQTLLISTTRPVTEIAMSVGFGNHTHFDSMFKKYIGMSPSVYRSTYIGQTEEGDPEQKEEEQDPET